MWILEFLPNWVLHLTLAIGVLGTVASLVLGQIPGLKKFVFPVAIVSILILSLAVYLEGALADNEIWESRVKELEAKMAKTEAESQKQNVKIVEKVVRKIDVVHTKGQEVVQYVDREVTKYDNTCTIPEVVIKAHNAAAKNESVELK
jgi:uncharacterized membrane protein